METVRDLTGLGERFRNNSLITHASITADQTDFGMRAEPFCNFNSISGVEQSKRLAGIVVSNGSHISASLTISQIVNSHITARPYLGVDLSQRLGLERAGRLADSDVLS